jgi:hypothetical protein
MELWAVCRFYGCSTSWLQRCLGCCSRALSNGSEWLRLRGFPRMMGMSTRVRVCSSPTPAFPSRQHRGRSNANSQRCSYHPVFRPRQDVHTELRAFMPPVFLRAFACIACLSEGPALSLASSLISQHTCGALSHISSPRSCLVLYTTILHSTTCPLTRACDQCLTLRLVAFSRHELRGHGNARSSPHPYSHLHVVCTMCSSYVRAIFGPSCTCRVMHW